VDIDDNVTSVETGETREELEQLGDDVSSERTDFSVEADPPTFDCCWFGRGPSVLLA